MQLNINELKAAYKKIEDQALDDYETVAPLDDGYIVRDYQDAVQDILECDNPDILFAMLEGKDYSRLIWKILEKQYNIPDIEASLVE